MIQLQESYTEVGVGGAEEEHCHWSRPEPPSAVPQLVAAIVLCAIFMICELIGGYLADSLSVMSDAAHMLSDCGGFALALLAFRCAARAPTATMSYGYRRAEVVGAVASVLALWGLTGALAAAAAARLRSGQFDIQPDMMMLVSGAGVAFNIVLALVLHGCAKDIAHHHSHGGAACTQGARRASRHAHNGVTNGDLSLKDLADTEAHVHTSTARNINLRAALIHVIGDLIQSCGVLLAAIIIKIYPSAKVIDPVCTFVFGVVAVLTSARVLRDALAMLMQAAPRGFRMRECGAALAATRGVRHVHSLHAWALSTHHTVLTVHVAIDELADWEEVLQSCQRVARQFGVASAAIQVERYRGHMEACERCRPAAP
ncbi:zinc transporter 2-like isoform X2 [Aricia agestis]|uniref:zinc transporter 2-like isoform X2 n=1 Tax=Aricia agestis TaxID=91739 RepID=UPI001C209B05|nr:zinc transporter 2-like isoform X2 [Aricia agestis]